VKDEATGEEKKNKNKLENKKRKLENKMKKVCDEQNLPKNHRSKIQSEKKKKSISTLFSHMEN